MSAPFYAEGGYIGKVTQQAVIKAKTGTPQIVIRFTVVSTSNGEAVAKNYERTIYRAVTANTAEYIKEDLVKLGLPKGSSIRLLDPNTPGYHNLTDTPIDVYCKHEADAESNVSEKWQLSRAFPSKPIEGEAPDYDALDAMMGVTSPKGVSGVQRKNAKSGSRSATSASASNGAAAMTDDELTAAVLTAIQEKGGTLKRSDLPLMLLKAKAKKPDIDKATSDAFLSGSPWWKLEDGVLLTENG